MPLYMVVQLACDVCGDSIHARVLIDVLNHKKMSPRLEPVLSPAALTHLRFISDVSRDPADWVVRPGYPDVVLCPRCKEQPHAGDDGTRTA